MFRYRRFWERLATGKFPSCQPCIFVEAVYGSSHSLIFSRMLQCFKRSPLWSERWKNLKAKNKVSHYLVVVLLGWRIAAVPICTDTVILFCSHRVLSFCFPEFYQEPRKERGTKQQYNHLGYTYLSSLSSNKRSRSYRDNMNERIRIKVLISYSSKFLKGCRRRIPVPLYSLALAIFWLLHNINNLSFLDQHISHWITK